MAQILKGAPVVAAMNEANAARCAALKEKGIVPTLAVVRVGAREDDISYEKGIVTRCGKVGVEVRQFHLAEDVTQEELLDVIRQINGDASVHGCLIFRPLPKRFDDRRVQEALDLVLVPCTAFDAVCRRVGMGKGYYDRYLPRCRNAVALGVAFEAQRVPEAAADEQDRRLDGFVTERKVYRGTDEFEL